MIGARAAIVSALLALSPAAARAELGPLGAPIRGLTIGPIENARHRDRGYGSEPYARAIAEAKALGATWVSLTPFGRVLDLAPTGVDMSFEAPFDDNRAAVLTAIRQARAAGLKVLVVPHLWVESGGWRALIEPGTDAGWATWSAAYQRFAVTWAKVAAEGGAEMFAVGVEQRSWVTSSRAPSYLDVIRAVRAVYPGLVTYSANWDDAEDSVILGELDVIGVNAFFPLTTREGAPRAELVEGGRRVRAKMERLASRWARPVMFAEIGYTTRKDPALRPWEWPDGMKNVVVDQAAQADAYFGLLAPMLSSPSFAGFFVWRVYADPDDVSQESEWGFSPRGKLAERIVGDAFRARWATDAVAPGDLVARASISAWPPPLP